LALHGRLRGLGDTKGDTTADSVPTPELTEGFGPVNHVVKFFAAGLAGVPARPRAMGALRRHLGPISRHGARPSDDAGGPQRRIGSWVQGRRPRPLRRWAAPRDERRTWLGAPGVDSSIRRPPPGLTRSGTRHLPPAHGGLPQTPPRSQDSLITEHHLSNRDASTRARRQPRSLLPGEPGLRSHADPLTASRVTVRMRSVVPGVPP
jgi:hypothetical protein